MKCPHCKNDVTITGVDVNRAATHLESVYKRDKAGLVYAATVRLGRCPNHECGQMIVWWSLNQGLRVNSISAEAVGLDGERFIAAEMVYPKVSKDIPELPSYVPAAICADIIEACKIQDLSPKASATLIRRALQGMIRDYWKIVDKTLNREIEEIKDKIDPMTWDAIDAVRKIGNIGAHMEKDVDVIIDIEPGEADVLIQLALDLINDWYVTRHNREVRKTAIIKMAAEKKP